MGTTAGGLPYPESTDPVAQGADAIEALALALDQRLWEPTWTTPVFASGWSTNNQGGYRRTRDGIWVIMRGSVDRDGAAIAAGSPTTLMTLPAGIRPGKWSRFVIATSSTPWSARLQIGATDGVCTLSASGGVPTGGYVHLDGILYTTVA